MQTLAVLDTTVFIDAKGSDPELSHASKHVLNAVLNHEIQAAISVVTVQEVFHLLARRTGDRSGAIDFARRMSNSYELIETDRALSDEALERLRQFEPIGGNDALILAGAHRIGATALVTRDRGLGEAAGLLWVDPSNPDDLLRLLSSS